MGDENDFYNELNKWIESANEINANDEIILDKKLFKYDTDTKKYSLETNAICEIKKAKFCFIGDNPGENEKKHREYFYASFDKRTAGCKIKEMLKKTCDVDYIFFNKCLISTPRTINLKRKDIAKTEELVVTFLTIVKKYNPDLQFVFFGVDKKFKSLYSKLGKKMLENSFLSYHPCSSKFSKDLNGIINEVPENTFAKKFPELFIAIYKDKSNGDDDSDGESSKSVSV